MSDIMVRFDDMSERVSAYKFKPFMPDQLWSAVPRLGDTILDANEFKYKVTGVIWYSQYEVRIQLERL